MDLVVTVEKQGLKIKKYKVLKADLIKKYIFEYEPTRKQLIRFILVNMNGSVRGVDFDSDPRAFRGHYSTALAQMRRSGNITTVKGRYKLTKQALSNDLSLYQKPYKEQVKDLKLQIQRIHKNYEGYRSENHILKHKLSNIAYLAKEFV